MVLASAIKPILKFRYKDEKNVNFFQKDCILLIFHLFFALQREWA